MIIKTPHSRLERIRALIDRKKIDGVLLTQQKNVSWFIGGRTHVNIAAEAACCIVLITKKECKLFVNNIEVNRLLEEECIAENLFTSIEIWDWYTPGQKEELINRSTHETKVNHDIELEPYLLLIRSIVEEGLKEEMRLLGKLTAEAIEEVAYQVKRGETEFQIAGRLAAACYIRGLDPIVNLIAVDERIMLRRHPLPTNKPLDSYAMIVVCARSKGLIASATRLVHFGNIPQVLSRKMEAVIEIDARMIEASRPGKSLEVMFQEIKEYYKDTGYEEEYKLHHQGGLTGYATRERLSTLYEKMEIQENQLYAWNPSITGVKSEDTILIQHNVNEIITVSNKFPKKEIKVNSTTYKRPWFLQRNY